MNRPNSFYQNMGAPYPYKRGMQNNPFHVPRMGAKEITPLKKPMTFRHALTSAEKGIDTISSMIPIYQKVKPIVTSGKDFVTNFKDKFFKNKKKEPEKVDVEIVDMESKAEKRKEMPQEKIIKEETKPNKPFF